MNIGTLKNLTLLKMDSPSYTLNDFRQEMNALRPKASRRQLKDEDEFQKPVATAIKNLQASLWRTILSGKRDEVFSPYATSTLLALIKSGTGEMTDKEVQLLCNFPVCPYMLSKGFAGINEDLATATVNMQFMIANAVFVANGSKFTEDFVSYAAPYAATLGTVDFTSSGSAAAEIDRWASEITGRKLAAIASTEDVDSKTRMVIASVLAFKGYWARGFSSFDTQMKPFHVAQGKTTNVPFMRATYKFPSADFPALGCKAVGLQYKNRRLIMVVVVPSKVDGLKELLKKLDVNFHTNVRTSLRISREIALELPKWKSTWKLELKPALQALGIKSLFSNAANLSYMFDDMTGMYVSDVIQETSIEVSEDGDDMISTNDPANACLPKDIPTTKFPLKDDPVEMKVNRPFLYYIYDDKFGIVLCSGTQSFI